MPVIKTYSGDLPYQAGYKSGKTARQLYDDEKRRQDAKYQAELEFNDKKLNAEKEIESLKIMRQKELDVQSQLNWEADLQVRKDSNQALANHRAMMQEYKEADALIKQEKAKQTQSTKQENDNINLRNKAIANHFKEYNEIPKTEEEIQQGINLLTGKAPSNPYADVEEYKSFTDEEKKQFDSLDKLEKNKLLDIYRKLKNKNTSSQGHLGTKGYLPL